MVATSLRPYSPAICLVLAVCTSAGPDPQQAQENAKVALIFRAEPVRNKVLLGEPIYIKLTLENVGRRNVLVNRSFHLNYQVWFEVTGPGGEKEEWCGIIPDWAVLPGDFVFLAPGAHVSGIVRATCAARGKSWGYRFPVAGQYSIVASYGLPYPKSDLRKAAGSALVVKGPVYAKPIQLTVLPAEKPGATSGPAAHDQN